MSNVDSPYRRWRSKAENDLLNIRNNLRSKRVPWDTVCFHAQQAAEKTLKAFLVFKGWEPSRTHDLVALLAVCAEIEPGLADLEEDCRKLTAYSVGARYPDDLFEPDEDDGREMVAATQRVCGKMAEFLPA